MILEIDVQNDPPEIQFEGNTLRITNIPVNKAIELGAPATSLNLIITLLHSINDGMVLDRDHKINLIKAVRSFTNLGLKESNDLVELHCPCAKAYVNVFSEAVS